MEKLDVVVVGAGVVGLAAARACALAGREVVVLEASTDIGSGISSRNSEVIHAGLYYPPGSLKARLCRDGRDRLYDYCRSHGIGHKQTGKLVVATDPAQVPALRELMARGIELEAGPLRWLDKAEARAMEPNLRCEAAFLSPLSGIVDSHALMLALLGDLEAAGGWLVRESPLLSARPAPEGGLVLEVGGPDPMTVAANLVVLAAGLETQALAGHIEGLPAASIPPLYLAKGNYFSLSAPSPFTRLIYPMPEPGIAGLGTHVTLDLAGRTRFGPDVQWVETVDYHVPAERADPFYAAIRRYWPDLRDGALVPDYAGIRPKLSGPGMAAADFHLSGPSDHGLPGLMALYGIESPGLTACLALADEIIARCL